MRWTPHERARPPRRRGLALLMVLVLLVALSSALTLQTRAAMGRSMAVDARALAVQQDWALRSVAATLAPQAPRLLGQAAAEGENESARRRPRGPRPRARWNGAVRLGAVEVAVVVTDEQAKLNLHALSPDAAAPALARLMGPDAATRHVRLRPLRSVVSEEAPGGGGFDDEDAGDDDGSESESGFDDGPDSGPPDDSDADGEPDADEPNDRAAEGVLIEPGRFAGYGQVLHRPQPEQMLGRGGLADHWGLWGPGALHYATATPTALRVALADELPDEAVDALLNARKRGQTLEEATSAAQRALESVRGPEDAEADVDADDGFEDDFGSPSRFDDGFDEDGFPDEEDDLDDDFSDPATEGGQDETSRDWRRWLTDKSETHGLWLVATSPGRRAGQRAAAFYVVGAERRARQVHQW